MNRPARGLLHEVTIEGTRIDRAVVISEDAWNHAMADSVIVPFYRDANARGSLLRPRLDESLIADCTAVGSIAHDDLSDEPIGECSEEVMAAVAAGVRSYFGIDRLLDPPRVRPRTQGRSDWWPRQSEVHWATRIAPTAKPVAVISEEASNVTFNHAAAVRLTSQTKGWRGRWEVPLRDGNAISNDVHLVSYSGFDQKPRAKPPLGRLNAGEMKALAERLVQTLQL